MKRILYFLTLLFTLLPFLVRAQTDGRDDLKDKFGRRPSSSDYSDLIDAVPNLTDDGNPLYENSLQEGANITIDNTDPSAPIISATGAAGVTQNLYDEYEGFINVRGPPYNAVGDSTTNDKAAFAAAQAAALAANKGVYVPAGVYSIQGGAYPSQEGTQVMYIFYVPVKGAGVDKTKLVYRDTTGDNRGFRIQSRTSVERTQRPGIMATQTRALLDEQIAGLGQVTTSTAADASNFSPGESVSIASGRNPYDADDHLWIDDQIYKVESVDGGTGIITLDRNVEYQLTSSGFFGQTIAAWANTTGYTAGDTTDTGDTGSVYVALTSGTSSGTSPTDDTGVSWKKIMNDRGSLVEADEDYRPVIQVITDPVQDVYLTELTLETEDELINLFGVRKARNAGLKNVRLKGEVAFPLHAGNGATNVLYENVICDTETHTTFGNSFSRVFGGFNATVTLRNVTGQSGKGTDARGVFAESFCKVTIEGTVFGARNAGTTDTYGIYTEGGIVNLTNTKIIGYRYPLRYNTSAYSGFSSRLIDPYQPPIAQYVSVTGCEFIGMSARQFRISGVKAEHVYNATNFYNFNETYQSGNIQHPDQVDFRPFKIGTIWWEYSPTEAGDGTWTNIGPYVHIDGQVEDINQYHYVILGQKAYYSNPPASTEVDTRIRTENSGSTRFVFSNNSTSNDVTVSDTDQYEELYDSDGGGVRYFNPLLETLQHAYFFDGTDGGTVKVMLIVLIAER